MIKKFVVALATGMLVGQAGAAPITPTYGTFGDLASATFGGSGIPTDPTAIRTIDLNGGATVGGTTLTLGLTAHQRFSNPALTNDGAGTFFATSGMNDGTPGNPGTAATWNFAYYISAQGAQTLSNFDFRLYYDVAPGIGTDSSAMGEFNLNFITGASSVLQDSQNATFGFLCGTPPLSPVIIAPAACPFDANASGEYSFALVAAPLSSTAGGEYGRVAINVNVGTVPEPGTLALLGIALLGLAVTRRSRC